MSSELKPYARYKDSGVEWLGEVPEHWEVLKLKRVASRVETGRTPSQVTPSEEFDECVDWFTPGDFMGGKFLHESVRKMPTGVATSGEVPIFAAESVLLVGIGATLGKCAILKKASAANQQINAIQPAESMLSDFLYYFLSAQSGPILSFANASTIGILNQERTKAIPVPLPPLPEQHAIAEYLDAETGRIDTLISEQRELIELLKEKRQALISHCVTRGLDPDVPMKDSGVEWLGEVPEHWEVLPIGLVCNYYSYGFTNPMPTTVDGPPMITAADIVDGKVQIDSARRTSWQAFNNLLTPKSCPQSSDVLVTKDGTLGRIALAPEEPHCINQSVALLRVRADKGVPDFIKRVLESEQAQAKMALDAGGTSIKHIYITRLAKQRIPLPPLPEQRAIADYLDAETARIDALIKEAEETITLMQEHRSALISACVTGKVRVPGVADPAAEEQTA